MMSEVGCKRLAFSKIGGWVGGWMDGTQTRCCVMQRMDGLYNVQRCACFVKLIR